MNNIIVLDDNGNVSLLNKFAEDMVEVKNKIKELKKLDDEYTAMLQEAMEQNNIIKIENENLSVNYVASYDKETFDSKKFREEHQDLYDEYVNMTTVKPSVRIKVK